MMMPREIYLALTSDEGFDELMECYEGSYEVKFELAQDAVRRYVPGFHNASTYNSYRLKRNKTQKIKKHYGNSKLHYEREVFTLILRASILLR